MRLVTVDFESHPILPFRPDFPPAPTSLAIYDGDSEPECWAWGQEGGGNNCSEAEARAALEKVWQDDGAALLFQNSKFDISIAVERWGFSPLPWHRVEDTMFLGFLMCPYGPHGLKPMAEHYLGMPPDERNAVDDWVIANKADVVMTRRLFDYLRPKIYELGMTAAYNRERQLMPILAENERAGIRCDVSRLEQDVEVYSAAFNKVEDSLRHRLNASGLNFDADQDVASVLASAGVVDEASFTVTKGGQLSVSKDNLRVEMFNDPAIFYALGYRNRLKTCLSMFMQPWLAQAKRTGDTVHTSWNQIKAERGARTGRPSTNNHNFLNLSKSFEGKDDGYQHPEFLNVPPLPLVRSYMLPDEGQVWCRRDYSGQELRVFAHFEQGELHAAYQANPSLDVHKFVGDEMRRVAKRDLARKVVKTLNFLGVYGGGVPALQARLRCSRQEAQRLRMFHDSALPGRALLNTEIERVIRRGGKVRTAGGRLYGAPPAPNANPGQVPYYKLLNYICQGSAADVTKQAIIDWYDAPDRNGRFLVQVYDEIDISVPRNDLARQMQVLDREMSRSRISVELPSEGEWGDNWGNMRDYDDEVAP